MHDVILYSERIASALPYENVGLARIKSYLEMYDIACTIIYVDENDIKYMEIEESTLYGFSVYQTSYRMFDILGNRIKIKYPKAHIIAGSTFATSCKDDLLKCMSSVDYLVLGHGEYATLFIYNNIVNGSISHIDDHPNILTRITSSYKNVADINISKLPLPSRENVHQYGPLYSIPIYDSHGCVGKCSFCSLHKFSKWSGRSARSLYEEIHDIYNKYRARLYFFTSSSFEDAGKKGRDRIIDLCSLVNDGGFTIQMGAYARAESFSTQESLNLLRVMVKAGFSYLYVGVDAANASDLQLYNKRASYQDNYNMVDNMREANIKCQLGMIMFNPYTTLDRVDKNMTFLRYAKSSAYNNYVHSLYINPGTSICETVENDGLLREGECLCEYMYEYHDEKVDDIFIKSRDVTRMLSKIAMAHDVDYYNVLRLRRFSADSIKHEADALEEAISSTLYEIFKHIYFTNMSAKQVVDKYFREYEIHVKKYTSMSKRMIIKYLHVINNI